MQLPALFDGLAAARAPRGALAGGDAAQGRTGTGSGSSDPGRDRESRAPAQASSFGRMVASKDDGERPGASGPKREDSSAAGAPQRNRGAASEAPSASDDRADPAPGTAGLDRERADLGKIDGTSAPDGASPERARMDTPAVPATPVSPEADETAADVQGEGGAERLNPSSESGGRPASDGSTAPGVAVAEAARRGAPPGRSTAFEATPDRPRLPSAAAPTAQLRTSVAGTVTGDAGGDPGALHRQRIALIGEGVGASRRASDGADGNQVAAPEGGRLGEVRSTHGTRAGAEPASSVSHPVADTRPASAAPLVLRPEDRILGDGPEMQIGRSGRRSVEAAPPKNASEGRPPISASGGSAPPPANGATEGAMRQSAQNGTAGAAGTGRDKRIPGIGVPEASDARIRFVAPKSARDAARGASPDGTSGSAAANGAPNPVAAAQSGRAGAAAQTDGQPSRGPADPSAELSPPFGKPRTPLPGPMPDSRSEMTTGLARDRSSAEGRTSLEAPPRQPVTPSAPPADAWQGGPARARTAAAEASDHTLRAIRSYTAPPVEEDIRGGYPPAPQRPAPGDGRVPAHRPDAAPFGPAAIEAGANRPAELATRLAPGPDASAPAQSDATRRSFPPADAAPGPLWRDRGPERSFAGIEAPSRVRSTPLTGEPTPAAHSAPPPDETAADRLAADRPGSPATRAAAHGHPLVGDGPASSPARADAPQPLSTTGIPSPPTLVPDATRAPGPAAWTQGLAVPPDPAVSPPPRAAPRAAPATIAQPGDAVRRPPVDSGGAAKVAAMVDTPAGATGVAEPGAVDRGLTEPRGGVLPPLATSSPEGGRPAPASPPQVALQVAEAVRQAGPTGTLEIALEPEELGRVRLVFSAAEAGLAVTLQADRSETLEMLRRHVDLLVSDLRARGFEDVHIDIGGNARGGQGEASGDGGGARPDAPGLPADSPPPDAASGRDIPAPTSGLDLRL